MAEGIVVDIDNKLLERLDRADRSLNKLISTVDRTTESFNKLASGGLSSFASIIDKITSSVGQLSTAKVGDLGLNKTTTEAKNAADAVNMVVNTAQKLTSGASTQPSSTSSFKTTLDEIKLLEKQLTQYENALATAAQRESKWKKDRTTLKRNEGRPSDIRNAEVSVRKYRNEAKLYEKEIANIQQRLTELRSSLASSMSGFNLKPGMNIAELEQMRKALNEVLKVDGAPSGKQQEYVDKLRAVEAEIKKQMTSSSQALTDKQKKERDEYQATIKQLEQLYATRRKVEGALEKAGRNNLSGSKSATNLSELHKNVDEEIKALEKKKQDAEKKSNKILEDIRLEHEKKMRDITVQSNSQTLNEQINAQNRELSANQQKYAQLLQMEYNLQESIRKAKSWTENSVTANGYNEANVASANAVKKAQEELDIISQARKDMEKTLGTEIEAIRDDFRQRNAKKELDAAMQDAKARENALKSAEKKRTPTFDEAMKYSRETKSINEQLQAIQKLKAARDNLDKSALGNDAYRQQVRQLNDEIKRQQEEVDKLTDKHKQLNSIQQSLSATARTLGGILGITFSIQSINGFLNKMVNTRAEFELQRRSLEALLGSKSQANKLWNQTVDLALRSPFQVKKLVTYTKQLAAYRVESSKLHDTTKRLADISAGLGVEMNRLILAYGQVKAANFLRGTELRQFSEAGLNMLDELAKYYSAIEGYAVTVDEVFERVSRREVSFEDVDTVIRKVTDEGGMFYRMQEKQAETLKGKMSNLKDQIDLMMNEIGESNSGVISMGLDAVSFLVKNWEDIAYAIKLAAVAFAFLKIEAIAAWGPIMRLSQLMMPMRMTFRQFQGTLGTTAASMKALKKGLSQLASSFASTMKNIASSLKKHWILAIIMAIIAAVAALVSKISSYSEAMNEVAKKIDDLNKSVRGKSNKFFSAKESGDIEKQREALIDLISLAEEDYTLAINVDIQDLDEAQMAAEVDKITAQMRRINSAYEALLYDYTENEEGWALTNHIEEDVEEMMEVVNPLLKDMDEGVANISKAYFSLPKELFSKYGRAQLKRIETASQVANNRYEEAEIIADAANRLLGEINVLQKKKGIDAYNYDKFEEQIDKLLELSRQSFGYATDSDIFEGKHEINSITDAFVARLKNMSQEEQAAAIRFALNADEAIGSWNEWAQGYLVKNLSQKLEIPIDVIYNVNAEVVAEDAKPWQQQINEAIYKEFKGEDVVASTNDEISKILSEDKSVVNLKIPIITDFSMSKAEAIKAAEDWIRSVETTINEDQKILSKEAVVYINAFKEKVAAMRTIFNISDPNNNKPKETSYWSDLANVVKDANKAFNDLSKTFDKSTAKTGMLAKYTEALNDALSKVRINGEKLDAQQFLAQYDITSQEGLEKALDDLIERATGKEKTKIIRLKADIVWDDDVKDKKEADAKIKKDVEELFSGYELYVKLSKLDVPKDFAQGFFDAELLSLDELRQKVMMMRPQFEGADMLNQYEEFIKKIDDMEQKAQQERLEEYLKYSRKAVGERAKIKLEEYKKLSEIAKTFAYDENDTDADEDRKDLARTEAIKAVQAEAKSKLEKYEWEEFQKTDVFINLFEDLDNASSALVEHSITKLEEFKSQWSSLPVEDMKAITEKINQLREAQAEDSPIRALRDANKIIKEDGRSREEAEVDLFNAEAKLLSEQQRLEALQQIRALESEGNYIASAELVIQYDLLDAIDESGRLKSDAISKQEDIVNGVKTERDAVSDVVDAHKKKEMALQKAASALEKVQKMVHDLYDSYLAIAEVLGEEENEWAKMSMGILDAVVNCMMLQANLAAAAAGATAFGAAMNAAMGIIGWIVMAVQVIANVFGAIFAAKDKRLEKKINILRDQIEDLQKKLEKLEQTLEKAFTTDTIEHATEATKENIEAQIAAYNRMIKLEKDKKKTDRDQIKEWQDSITELREQYNQILEDTFSTATAGILDDVLSVTNDFVSAWYDAFKETGDGMSGLEQTFNDMLLNMLKQQASMQLISPYINSYKEWLKDYVDIEAGDADLSIEEARAWAERVKETMPEVSSLLQNFFSGAEGLLSETGELSELGKGIQGVTETTAQALEAYLNSIRFFVADDNDRMQRIEAWLTSNDTSRNPILNELRTHTNLMQSIKDAVESVVGRGVGGAYFKVQMM